MVAESLGTRARRITVAACLLGWMFDGLDFMVVTLLAKDISGELIGTGDGAYVLFGLAVLLPTKLAAAFGGIYLGTLADRFGRRNVLAWSILVYSVATGLCAFAPNLGVFVALRVVAGLGLGAEWAVGFAMLNEFAASPERRGHLGGLTESLFAAGYILAVVLQGIFAPAFGWRGVMLAASFPALLVVLVRRFVPESPAWRDEARRDASVARPNRLRELLGDPAMRSLFGRVFAVAVAGMFAVWLVIDWLPTFLRDAGYSDGYVAAVPIILGLVGGFFTWVSGYVSDRVGRRRAVQLFALVGLPAMAVFAASLAVPGPLLLVATVLFAVSLGYFGAFGAWWGELFPTRIRATALAFAYNGGRAVAAPAAVLVPLLADRTALGLGLGMALASLAFAALVWAAGRVPETRAPAAHPKRDKAATPDVSTP